MWQKEACFDILHVTWCCIRRCKAIRLACRLLGSIGFDFGRLRGIGGNTPLCASTHDCRGRCTGNTGFTSADQWDISHGVCITRHQAWAVFKHIANWIGMRTPITRHMCAEQHVIQVVNTLCDQKLNTFCSKCIAFMRCAFVEHRADGAHYFTDYTAGRPNGCVDLGGCWPIEDPILWE